MEIKRFVIRKLFGMYNIDINLKNDVNIYVGENGLGKTTLLNCLYYMLTCNFEKLRDMSFESIKIEFDNKKEFIVNYRDIIEYTRGEGHYSNYDESRYYRYIINIFSDEEIKNLVKVVMDERYEDNLLRNYAIRLNELSGLPIRIAERTLYRYCLEYLNGSKRGDKDRVTEFVNFIKDNAINNNITYFTTYRRIENGLLSIVSDREREREDYARNKFFNGLIHFGMDDVNKLIIMNLERIRSLAISGYNQMTGILLKQYVNSNIKDKYNIDITKLNIALDRMEDKIDAKTKKSITQIVSDKNSNITEKKYLFNLLENLIINYEKQNKYDEKIKGFVNTCNKYLIGKKFVYNESDIDLKIVNDTNGNNININNLSSGEKQIISIFAKLYLELDEKSLILIDEPELSLSIKWQAMLIPDIMKTGKCKKIIAVTHSPFIFDNEFENSTRSMNEVFKMQGENNGR